MLSSLRAIVDKSYTLLQNPNTARQFKAAGMRFTATSYSAENFGHIGVMSARGFFGLMTMETFILNPFFVDAPLLSLDRMSAFGREVLLVEMYDSMLEDTFQAVEMTSVAKNFPSASKETGHWYDSLVVEPSLVLKGNRKDASLYDSIAETFMLAYLADAGRSAACDPVAKKRKAAAYSEGLLVNGGPATDPVKKAMGEDFTAELFRKVLFGVGA